MEPNIKVTIPSKIDIIENKPTVSNEAVGNSIKVSTPSKIMGPASFTTGATFSRGYSSVSPRNFDISSYAKLMTHVNTNLSLDVLNEEIARGQSVGRMLGNSVIQFGGTILGDTVASIGALFKFGQTGWQQLRSVFNTDFQPDWNKIMNKGIGAAFQEAGKSINEGSRDLAPIYLTKEASKGGLGGGMGDASWWASSFPTLGSSVASLIPMFAQMRALNWAGKVASKANQASLLGRGTAALGRGLTNRKFQTTLGAIQGAHLDVMMEIVHDYDNKLQYAKNLGFNDEDALKYASEYASTAYNDSWLYGLVFNAIELRALTKGLNKTSKTLSGVNRQLNKNIPEMAMKGNRFTGISEEVADLSKLSILRSRLGNSTNYFKLAVTEGLEEMRVDIALQEGELSGKKLLGVYDPRNNQTFTKRLVDFIQDTRNWDSFLWGAAGGVTLYGSRALLNKLSTPQSFRDYNQDQYTRISNVLQDTVNTIATFEGDLSFDVASKTDPFLTAMVPIFNALYQNNATEYGEKLLTAMSNLGTQETIDAYGSDKSEIIKNLLQEFKIANDIFKRNKDVKWNTKYDELITNNISTNEYIGNYFNRKLSEVEIELDRQKILYNDYNKEMDSRLYDIDNQYHNILKNIDSTEQSISYYRQSISKLNTLSSDIKSELKKYNEDKNNIDIKDKEIKTVIESLNTNIKNNIQEIKRLKQDSLINKDNVESNNELVKILRNEIVTHRENLNKSKSNLINNKLSLRNINSKISYLSEEKNNNDYKINLLNKELEIYNKTINTINVTKKEYETNHSDKVKEYNSVKFEYKDVENPNIIPIQNLESVRDILNEELARYDVLNQNKKEYAKILSDEYKSITDEYEKELEEIQNDIEEQELFETELEIIETELENIPDTVIEIADVSIVRNEKGVIIGYTYNNKKYDISSAIDNSKIKSISEERDNIIVTLEDNRKLTHIEIDKLSNIVSESVLEQVYEAFDRFNESSFANRYTETMDKLFRFINGKSFKRYFLTPTTNLEVADRRHATIQQIYYYTIQYNSRNVESEETYKFFEDLTKQLEVYTNQLNNALNTTILNNYISNKFTIVLSDKSSEINHLLQSVYLPQLINPIANFISKNGIINVDKNQFVFNANIQLDFINNQLDNIFKEFKSIITNRLYKEFELENFSNLNTKLNEQWTTFKEQINNDYNTQYSKVKELAEKKLAEQERLKEEQINQEDSSNTIMMSINELALAFDENTVHDIVNSNYTDTDYRYYVSPSDLSAYNALENIISKFKITNPYNKDRKLTYKDILDIIYNSENGDTEIERLYLPIWRALKHMMNYDRIDDMKASIKENVPQSQYVDFFNTIDDIRNGIVPPIKSLESRYLDGNDNPRRSFIKDYIERQSVNKVSQNVKEGTILSVNNIWKSLAKHFDNKTKTLSDTITIDGKDFTSKEIIDTYKNLKDGQNLITTISEDKQSIDLSLNVNGKNLKIGTLGLNEHLVHNNIPLSKENRYDNAFGTPGKLNNFLQGFINSLSKSDRAFNIIRNYFKTYYEARGKNALNSFETETKLRSIIEELDIIGKQTDVAHSTIMNSIFQLSNYNTEREGTDEINHDSIFGIIQPIFYEANLRVGIEQLDNIENNYINLKNIYESLNNRLYEQYRQTEIIKNAILNNPTVEIVISHLNKTGISFSSTKSKNNINSSIQKDVILNKKSAVNIISRQEKKGRSLLSSMTLNQKVDNNYSVEKLLSGGNKSQLYAEIRMNGNEDGVSYIPIYINSLSSHSIGLEFTKDTFNKLITDRFLTNLSSQESDATFTSSENFKSRKNEEFNNLIDDLSEIIITDSNRDNGRIPWFNVSNLFTNRNKKGNSMEKTIEFISTKQGEWSYGYTFRIVYDYNENTNVESKIRNIEITRVRTSESRIKDTTGKENKLKTSQPFTESILRKNGFIKSDSEMDIKEGVSYSINPYNKGIRFNIKNNSDIIKLLNSPVIESVIGDMQRNVKSTFNNGSYTYTSQATGKSFGKNINQIDGTNIVEGSTKGSKIFKSGYTSAILEWGKQKGIYKGNTTFDSIQDFYLDTEALVTNVSPIMNEDGNEVITNYQIDVVNPAVYVKLKNPNTTVVQTDINMQKSQSEFDIAKEIYKNISNPIDIKQGNFLQNLKDGKGLNREIFEAMGIINSETSNEAYEEIKNFYENLLSKYPIPLYLINSLEEFKNILSNFEEQIDIESKDISDEYDSLEGAYLRDVAIILKESIFQNNYGGEILNHEIIHHAIRKAIQNNEITKDQISDIIDLINKIVNKDKSLKFNIKDNTYDSLIKFINKAIYINKTKENPQGEISYDEFLAHLFTNKTFARILNKIYFSEPYGKTTETIWSRIFDMFIKILGIKINDNSVLQEVKNILSNSIVSESPTNISAVPLATGKVERSEAVPTINHELFDIMNINDDDIENRESIMFRFSDDRLIPNSTAERVDTSPIIGDTPLNSQKTLLSLNETDEIQSFKDTFSDSDNLKIC